MEKLVTLPWVQHAAAQAVLAAFSTAGAEIRFVGGCVRDALLDIQTSDIDMATPASPNQTTHILQAAGIKAVPTGIDHGTITAVANSQKVEITTLREDIETHGRHATVKFGTDWALDAARRDFTINALYSDADGNITDYFGGIDDARARRVRFIGDAAQRIREDYLRILRFFRFTARFGNIPDGEGLQACMELRDGIRHLARERIWMEFEKILCLSKPLRALQPMLDAGVLQQILPNEHLALNVLGRLADYEHDNHVTPAGPLRLAALNADTPEKLQELLALSNRTHDWLQIARESLRAGDLKQLRNCWYHLDEKIKPREWLQNLALLLLADDDIQSNGDEAQHIWPTDLFAIATAWETPLFPLAGADVMALGIPSGPEVGNMLALVEAWWLDNNFKPSREQCLQKLNQVAV